MELGSELDRHRAVGYQGKGAAAADLEADRRSAQQPAAYITFGLPRYSVDEMVKVAKMLVADGQSGLKMVVGSGANPYHEINGQPDDRDILKSTLINCFLIDT